MTEHDSIPLVQKDTLHLLLCRATHPPHQRTGYSTHRWPLSIPGVPPLRALPQVLRHSSRLPIILTKELFAVHIVRHKDDDPALSQDPQLPIRVPNHPEFHDGALSIVITVNSGALQWHDPPANHNRSNILVVQQTNARDGNGYWWPTGPTSEQVCTPRMTGKALS